MIETVYAYTSEESEVPTSDLTVKGASIILTVIVICVIGYVLWKKGILQKLKDKIMNKIK